VGAVCPGSADGSADSCLVLLAYAKRGWVRHLRRGRRTHPPKMPTDHSRYHKDCAQPHRGALAPLQELTAEGKASRSCAESCDGEVVGSWQLNVWQR